MSWREDYRQGSFRGVPFRTVNARESGGRRGETHEFPQRDTPWREDLGRLADSFAFECWVAGPDYMAQRDALRDALRAFGPGTLIHPFRGTMQVSVEDYEIVEDAGASGGGIADFSISFVEAGSLVSAPAAPDSGAQARSAADTALAQAPAQFADRFSVAALPAFVEEAAAELVRGAALAASIQSGLLGGAGPALRAFDAGFRQFAGASTLVRAPVQLGLAVVGLVQAIGAMGGTAARRASALAILAGYGDRLDPVIGDTPARAAQRANQAAIAQLIGVAASAEMVRAIADQSFASYDDAVAARDAAAELIDGLAVRAADAGDDAGAASLDALRQAMVRDVTARGGTLDRLARFTPQATEPALVIAHRLYGPAEVAARAEEIVERNAIAHPAFVPGGVAIEIRTPGAIDG